MVTDSASQAQPDITKMPLWNDALPGTSKLPGVVVSGGAEGTSDGEPRTPSKPLMRKLCWACCQISCVDCPLAGKFGMLRLPLRSRTNALVGSIRTTLKVEAAPNGAPLA